MSLQVTGPTIASTPDGGTMPFRSKAQARFMFARHPKIAARWVRESSKKHPVKNLPAKKGKRH